MPVENLPLDAASDCVAPAKSESANAVVANITQNEKTMAKDDRCFMAFVFSNFFHGVNIFRTPKLVTSHAIQSPDSGSFALHTRINISLHREVRQWARSASCARGLACNSALTAAAIPAGTQRDSFRMRRQLRGLCEYVS